MDDFNSETDSDYTSYWRDWVVSMVCIWVIAAARPFSPYVNVRLIYACDDCWNSGYIDAKLCKHGPDPGRLVNFCFDYCGLIMHDWHDWQDAMLKWPTLPILEQIIDMVHNDALFISSRGNEYFCEIDEEYLTDRFNLTGLNTEVQYYQHALDLVTDVFDFDCEDDMRDQIEKSARHLYGLVHARYIVTTRGLAKMMEKFKKSDFGKCPRVMCEQQPLLPMGQSDVANGSPVKLYCARCEDLYNPKSSRHSVIDGAYFGTSFHNILFQVYPAMLPPKSQRRYEPRVFGFKVHAAAALSRWQSVQREQMKDRLRLAKLDTGFEDEDEDEESDEEDEEMEAGDAAQL